MYKSEVKIKVYIYEQEVMMRFHSQTAFISTLGNAIIKISVTAMTFVSIKLEITDFPRADIVTLCFKNIVRLLTHFFELFCEKI